MVEVGYFVTMFIVDISLELLRVRVRSGEPLTAKPYEALQLTDRVFSHLKPREEFIFFLCFLIRPPGFCFKGNRLRKRAFMAFFFSADNILAFLPGISTSM